MKIVQINTYDITGGAARAAYRLHKGLREAGQDCRMLVKHKDSTDNTIYSITPQDHEDKQNKEFFLSQTIQGYYIDHHRTAISNTMFSLPYPGYDISVLPMVKAADIIHLHWISQYQSLSTLQRLFALGKPVVWTLHDQWAFTGGCHYGAGCQRYRKDCAQCPQLEEDPFNLPAVILKDKQALFKGYNPAIVTPSRWMAGCARESKVFGNMRIETIPNSLETDLFTPLPKGEAKERMGLSPNTATILFGAESVSEKRKGFKELMGAVQYCLTMPEMKRLDGQDQITILCFGQPDEELEAAGIPVVFLGYLESDEAIRQAYSAADIFIQASIEDNFPNTILEAMSCGTPVVAFDTGGIPEMVTNHITGQIVPVGDSRKMGQAILDLISDPDKRKAMGEASRKKVLKEYTLSIQARRFKEFYEELLEGSPPLTQTRSRASRTNEWEMNGSRGSNLLSVPMETEIGPFSKEIYDQMLFSALKEFAPDVQKKWDISEADRIARLDQVRELNRLLEKSEADRKRQINELKTLLEDSEADRNARLTQINELNRLLEDSETDRAARLDNMHALQKTIGRLEKELEREMQRAQKLANTLIVRIGRRCGLVKSELLAPPSDGPPK